MLSHLDVHFEKVQNAVEGSYIFMIGVMKKVFGRGICTLFILGVVLLANPVHVFAIDTISEVSPDALRALMTQSPKESTGGQVTLTISLTGEYLEILADDPYSWDDGVSWTALPYTSVEKNGDYRVIVKDKFGATMPSSYITVSNIDSEPPVLSVERNGNVLNVSASDAVSGVTKLYWMGPASGSMVYPMAMPVVTQSISLSSTGTYTVYACDAAGNVAYWSQDYTVIPFKYANVSEWFSIRKKSDTSATLTADIPDEAWKILADKPIKWTTDGAYTAKTSKKVKANGTYTVKVKDNQGNIISVSLTVNNIKTSSSSSSSRGIISSSSSSAWWQRSSSSSSSSWWNSSSSSNAGPTITATAMGKNVDISASDDSYGIVGIYFEGPGTGRTLIANVGGGRSFSQTFECSTDGSYTFYVTDMGGNTASKTVEVTGTGALGETAAPESATGNTLSDVTESIMGDIFGGRSTVADRASDSSQDDFGYVAKGSASSSKKGSHAVKLAEIEPADEPADDYNYGDLEGLATPDEASSDRETNNERMEVNPDDYKVSSAPYIVTGVLIVFLILIVLIVVLFFIAAIRKKKRMNDEDTKNIRLTTDDDDDDYLDGLDSPIVED